MEITGLFIPLRKIPKVWRKITCMFTLGLFKIKLKNKCLFFYSREKKKTTLQAGKSTHTCIHICTHIFTEMHVRSTLHESYLCMEILKSKLGQSHFFVLSKRKISTFKIPLSFSMFIVLQHPIICILFRFKCNIEPCIKANNKEMSMFLHWAEHRLKLNSEQ